MSLECKILKSYGLPDVIPFGKYKGKTVDDVLGISANWLLWADENIDAFTLKKSARMLAEEVASNETETMYLTCEYDAENFGDRD